VGKVMPQFPTFMPSKGHDACAPLFDKNTNSLYLFLGRAIKLFLSYYYMKFLFVSLTFLFALTRAKGHVTSTFSYSPSWDVKLPFI
jgi:hypothetical protein